MGMRARLLADFIAEHGRPPSLRERAALIGIIHGPSKKQRRAARSSLNARTPEGWRAIPQIVTCARCHIQIAGRIRIGGDPQLVLPLPHKEWNRRCPGANSLPVERLPRRPRETPKKIRTLAPSPPRGAGASDPDRPQSRPPTLGNQALPLCAVPGPGFVLRKKTDPQAAVKVHRANLQDLTAEDMGGADVSDDGERDAQARHQVPGTPREWGRAIAPHPRASRAGGSSDPQESEAPNHQGTLSHGWGPRRERPT